MSQTKQNNNPTANAGQNSVKKEELFRMECSTLPLAGRGEIHTMKEWKRIYGYERGYMFAGKFTKVENAPAPVAKHESKVDTFYADPTPANAVALAIADAKADGNGTPEFFHYLAKAENQLRAAGALRAAVLLAIQELENLTPVRLNWHLATGEIARNLRSAHEEAR